jgi:hypothetical protein
MKLHRISRLGLLGVLLPVVGVLALMVAAAAFSVAPPPPTGWGGADPNDLPYVTHPYIGEAAVTPSKAVAGKSFKVTFQVTDRGTGALLTKADMVDARPTIGGILLRPHIEKFADGMASVRLTVPKAAKGKTLAVSLRVKVGDRSAIRTVDYRVS